MFVFIKSFVSCVFAWGGGYNKYLNSNDGGKSNSKSWSLEIVFNPELFQPSNTFWEGPHIWVCHIFGPAS